MFHELGVHTIDGGPTLNPSTYDLLAGDPRGARPRRSCVLPNSANVIMAAEHAARLSDKQVLVAPTTSQQAGLAAAVALAPERSVEENAQAIERGARARAHRRGRAGRARRRAGALRARRGGRLRRGRGARLGRAARDAARRCSARSRPAATTAEAPELISVLAGEEAPLGARRARAGWSTATIELELRHGGQPAYWWLLAAE